MVPSDGFQLCHDTVPPTIVEGILLEDVAGKLEPVGILPRIVGLVEDDQDEKADDGYTDTEISRRGHGRG